MPLTLAAVVPFGTTFLIIGGYSGPNYSEKVYQYTTEGQWLEMPSMKLSEAKQEIVAMVIPSSLFD